MENIRPATQSRLKNNVTELKEVAGAASLAQILQGKKTDKGAYVFQTRESASSGLSTQLVIQNVDVQVSVVTTIYCVSDSMGGDAADASHDLRELIKAELIGWEPSVNFEPMEFAGGDLISFLDGFYVWRDNFTSRTIIQQI
jgi:hypothetical protein